MGRLLSFMLALVSAAVFLISILLLVMPELISSVLPVGVSFTNIELLIAMAISLALLFVSGNLLSIAREKEEFNEFGVRKKKARRRLSSYRREQVEALQLAETERIVTQAELKKAMHKGSTNPEEDLNKMIGLESVKKKVRDLKARMEFDLHSKNPSSSEEMHHMVFYGSPGTGKTTVARILAGLLYEYGYIDNNVVMEVDGNFLKSSNAADTEKKVRMILSKAKGGVLFVDEAYALTQSKDAAGKQAIATLIKEMEDSKEDFVAIFAGYPKEMKDMLNANPGFRSRIKDYVEFPDYNDGELRDLAIFMAGEKGFAIAPDAYEPLFERLNKERQDFYAWGNGRTVRNVIEQTIDNHAVNYTNGELDKKDKYLLRGCDVQVALNNYI